ncbi:MAG: hypothetical protein ABI137_11240 [Antricoccus sp.]
MGFTLACEFLRNLGWNGFKQDVHIKMLLGSERWLGTAQNNCFTSEATDLGDVIGSRSKEVIFNIRYRIAGLSITPDGMSASRIDNLVWLIGANIEKKNHESSTDYLIDLIHNARTPQRIGSSL